MALKLPLTALSLKPTTGRVPLGVAASALSSQGVKLAELRS